MKYSKRRTAPKGAEPDRTELKTVGRRALLKSAAGLATYAAFARAHGARLTDEAIFAHDHLSSGVLPIANVHDGKGSIDVKFFRFEQRAEPALLLIYDIPPGASEGVHTHRPGDKIEGSFDEFYYVIEGEGIMQIEGQLLSIAQGDHVFTPNGVAHGVENTARNHLKIFLTAIRRG